VTRNYPWCYRCTEGLCNPGEWRHICNGTIQKRDAVCRPCGQGCEEDGWFRPQCNGVTDFLDSICYPCTIGGCQKGFYRPLCNKTNPPESDPSCEPCNLWCGLGFYARGCDGNTTFDDSQCFPCDHSCAPNQYITGVCDEDTPAQCRDCRESCLPGEYISSPCSNQGNTDLGCTKCLQECPVGFFLEGSCDGTGLSDTARCRNCTTSCAPGEVRLMLCLFGETSFGWLEFRLISILLAVY